MSTPTTMEQIVIAEDGTAFLETIQRKPASLDLVDFIKAESMKGLNVLTDPITTIEVGRVHLVISAKSRAVFCAAVNITHVNFVADWQLSEDGKTVHPVFLPPDDRTKAINPSALGESMLWKIPAGMSLWLCVRTDRSNRAIFFCHLDKELAEKPANPVNYRPPFPNIFEDNRPCWHPNLDPKITDTLSVITTLMKDWMMSSWNHDILQSQCKDYLVWKPDGTQVLTDMANAPSALAVAHEVPTEWEEVHRLIINHEYRRF